MNLLFHHLFDILWKMWGMVRDQAAAAPDAANVAERAYGVRRANLPEPED
jgi:hypothetical protein